VAKMLVPFATLEAITPENHQMFCLKQFNFIKVINALVANGYKVIRQEETAGQGAIRKLCVSLQLSPLL
jgi:hypothetical protein